MIALAVLAAVAAPWFNIPRDQADSAGMLAHLHAFFVDVDLLYDNEFAALGMSPLFAFVTGEGVVSNHWPVGATWVQAPGYLLGLVAAKLLSALGVASDNALGVVPLVSVRAWAIVVLGGMAWGIHRWSSSVTDRLHATWITTVVLFGTPLWYYASESPLRPHLYGAAVTLVITWLWMNPRHGDRTGRAVCLGAAAGLAAAIRPQLAPLVLLAWHDGWQGPGRARRLAAATAAFAPWPLLVARMQLWMYGADLGRYGAQVTTHHTWQFLTSPYHGVLTWCPVLILGGLGVALTVARRERGAWLIAALLVLQVWLDGGMRPITPTSVLGTRTWAGGVSFGPRKLVDVVPLMLPGVLVLADWAAARGLTRRLAGTAIVLCAPTILLHLAAFAGPDRTTGQIHDMTSLLRTMAFGASPRAVFDALATRALPTTVAVVVGGVVVAPAVIAGVYKARWLATWTTDRLVLAGAVAVIGVGIVANAWLSWMIVRSSATLTEDPARMQDALRRLQPAHVATVDAIERHHDTLRRRLGPGAAPPRPAAP